MPIHVCGGQLLAPLISRCGFLVSLVLSLFFPTLTPLCDSFLGYSFVMAVVSFVCWMMRRPAPYSGAGRRTYSLFVSQEMMHEIFPQCTCCAFCSVKFGVVSNWGDWPFNTVASAITAPAWRVISEQRHHSPLNQHQLQEEASAELRGNMCIRAPSLPIMMHISRFMARTRTVLLREPGRHT
jgi:hypothetical protein